MVHTWKILDLERIADSGLINKITYECDSTHGDMSSRHIGHIEISGSVDSATFVDFDSLTHDTVLKVKLKQPFLNQYEKKKQKFHQVSDLWVVLLGITK